MIEGLVLGAYRRVMSGVAGTAALAAGLPLAPKRWRAFGDRLGRLGPGERAIAGGAGAIWLHAASVGELTAVRPLLARMKERFPERVYVISTLTRTGLALARQLPEAHLALLFPVDAPAPVRRLVEAFRLEGFLFTETEIWPTFLAGLEAIGVPAIMVSGRVSTRSAARARWLRPLYRRPLAHVTCCMQTEADAARIITLGADPRRVQVAGSLKFDATTAATPATVERLARILELSGRRLIVAGSTHEGEDEAVLEVYDRLVSANPELLLLLAPRHPERLEAVAALVRGRALPVVRFTEVTRDDGGALPPGRGVILLDVVGPLAHCYALGVAAFVGGSLVPVGGHNVLEPARAGRPVIVGPHTEHARDAVDRLLAGGGAMRVGSTEALALAFGYLLGEPGRAADMGQRARALVQGGQGAVERHLKIIAARLTSARFAHARAG